jgi:hypothetical protein
MLAPGTEEAKHRFFVTASANSFKELATKLMAKPISNVEELDLTITRKRMGLSLT